MTEVIEVSYTGDLLAHRRCPRAWAYAKQAGFHPYEQIQAMEGRLVHHAMEWMTREYQDRRGKHVTRDELRSQLEHYFRVLWARGIRTAFTSKKDTLDRVIGHLFPKGKIHQTVKAVVEGATHTEYELRAIKKLVAARHAGKSKLLLTGVLDVVVQQQKVLTYSRSWEWDDVSQLRGKKVHRKIRAKKDDIEIWDYKGTRHGTPFAEDYVRQLLTYAALYGERTGSLPARCVIFYINEPKEEERLVAIEVDEKIVDACLQWSQTEVARLQSTIAMFETDPLTVRAGALDNRVKPVDAELKKQCTACAQRFDCDAYATFLGARPGLRDPKAKTHPDIDLFNVNKN